MTNSISKVLQSIDGVTDYLTRYIDASIHYESKLSEFVRKERKLSSPPKESAIAAAVEAWNNAKADSSYSQLSKRMIRVLCCVSEIASTETFLNVLKLQSDDISPRMVRDLLGVYFGMWTERNQLHHFEAVLSSILRFYQGRSVLMQRWKENANKLLGDEAPFYLAEHLMLDLATIKSFFEDLQLPRQHAKFSNAVLVNLADLLVARLKGQRNPDLEVWAYFKEQLLELPTFHKNQLANILAKLILLVDGNRKLPDWEPIFVYVRDYVLCSPDLGDPRIETVKWGTFDEAAKQAFISWLAEEDISLFFELIIKNDPHQRKPYWLRYAEEAHNSMLIVGEADYDIHKDALKEFHAQGRTFGKGYGIPSSAFILDFGRIAIVEFSEINNACYVYNRADLPDLFKTTAAGWKDLRGLKDKDKSIHVQSHHRNWRDALDAFMLTHGVKPVD